MKSYISHTDCNKEMGTEFRKQRKKLNKPGNVEISHAEFLAARDARKAIV